MELVRRMSVSPWFESCVGVAAPEFSSLFCWIFFWPPEPDDSLALFSAVRRLVRSFDLDRDLEGERGGERFL